MHEAKWNREKDDTDNKRTRASILRTAISNASNERTSRQWARGELFEHAVAPEQARAAPVEHSALPRWLERHQSSILLFRSRSERHSSSILRLRSRLGRPQSSFLRLRGSRLERPFREPAAAPGQARAAISSHLRLRARLEGPFRVSCGSGPGSSGHFEPTAAPGQARCRKRRQVRCFRARAEPS